MPDCNNTPENHQIPSYPAPLFIVSHLPSGWVKCRPRSGSRVIYSPIDSRTVPPKMIQRSARRPSPSAAGMKESWNCSSSSSSGCNITCASGNEQLIHVSQPWDCIRYVWRYVSIGWQLLHDINAETKASWIGGSCTRLTPYVASGFRPMISYDDNDSNKVGTRFLATW